MSAQTLLLDTNVWVDFFEGARAGHAAARRLIERAGERGASLLYAASSAKDVFYLVACAVKADCRRASGGSLTHEQTFAATELAWGCLDNMAELATAIGCDQSDVWLARKRKRLHHDFEDNLVLSAAERAHVDLLVTNDDQMRRHAPVAAMGVADALAYLESLD